MAAFRSLFRPFMSTSMSSVRLLRAQPHHPHGSFTALAMRRHFSPMANDDQAIAPNPGVPKVVLPMIMNQTELAKLDDCKVIGTQKKSENDNQGSTKELSFAEKVVMFCYNSISGLAMLVIVHWSGVETMSWIASLDAYMNWNLASEFTEPMGKLLLTVAALEMMGEGNRFMLVIVTWHFVIIPC